MHYNNIHLVKFSKYQYATIRNVDGVLSVTCLKNDGINGIILKNVSIPIGKYTITTHISGATDKLFLYQSHDPHNKIYIQNGENNITLSFMSNLITTLGICFNHPTNNQSFKMHSFSIILNDHHELQQIQQTQPQQLTLNSYFPNVFVINLDHRVDRLFRINRILQQHNIKYERVSGIIPSNEQFEICKKKNSKLISKGALGCLLSHMYILEQAIKNAYDSILVLEDDVYLHQNFDQLISHISTAPQWDILYLGCTQHYALNECVKSSNNGFYKAFKSRGTFAIAIKKHMFQKLLDLYKPLMMNVDMYLEEIQSSHQCYVMYENLMIADVSNSDICVPRDIVDYSKKFGWNNINYYPKVSIILPVYNGANYLLECLESISRQTFRNYELIIINDGSNDATNKIIGDFSNGHTEMNIIWLTHKTNEGLPKSLNDGTLASHGNYLTWISHDNKYKPNAIQSMVNFLDQNPEYLLVTAGHEFIGNTTGKIYGSLYSQESLINNFHGIASFMYQRNVIKLVGLYDTNLFGIEDLDYWIRILGHPPYKNGYVNDILVEYRKHKDQLTNKIKNKYDQLKKCMLDKLKDTNNEILTNINPCLDTIVYPPTVKYSILLQRPQQILRKLTNYYNCIFITKDEGYSYKIDHKLIIVNWDTFDKIKDKIKKNNVIMYYTDPRTYKYVDIIKPNLTVFDLIDNPTEEFEVWRPNLPICVKTANVVTYSSIYLLDILKKINNERKYIYLSNGCDLEYFKRAIKKLNRPPNIPNNKIIIGYYGYITTWIDYDLIMKIANIPYIHVMMLGLIHDPKIICHHPNITWTGHIEYNKLIEYLSWFDICIIPFKPSEMMLGCNPIKLHEYMASGKPIISTIKFIDVPNGYHIINHDNFSNIIDTIIQNEFKNNCTPDSVITWDDIVIKLHDEIKKIQSSIGRRKIAYVTNMLLDWDTFTPRYGGGERYALEIATLLKSHDFDVHFYQMAHKTFNSTYYGFATHCIDMNQLESYGEFSVGYADMVNDIIRNDHYDYVIYGMPEMCCGNNPLSNSIAINHGIWFDRQEIIKNPKWYDYMKIHIKYPCKTICVDTNFINFVRVMCPEFAHKLLYIPNFYDGQIYKYSVKHNDKLRIVIPRRASTYRGSRIMEQLLKLIPHDVDICWVGKGDKIDDELLENLTKKDKRFTFTGVSFNEMYKIYDMADIVIIPTIASEGTSLSCIEAMASGCAVISTNIGGLSNLVINMFNGLLVNPTSQDIADATNLLILNPELRYKLIQNAYNMIQEFEMTKWRQKWLDVFDSIGWITQHKPIKNDYFNCISRDNLIKNFDVYWKNYIHQQKLHHDIKNKEHAMTHLIDHPEFDKMEICNNNIKICILTRNAVNGGVESIIYEESKYMNCDVYVTNGIIDKLNPFLYTNVTNESEILDVAKNYNVIIYHWLPKWAIHAVKLSNIPSIEYVHRRDTDDNDKSVPMFLISHSPFMINHCVTKFYKNTLLLEHPIDTTKFSPNDSIKSEYIGCVCTYNPIKGIDILINALALLNKHFKNELGQYKIVFYGKYQDNYLDELIRLAKQCNLECEFNGPIDTYTIINKYKLFIIPSRIEGLPIVLLEALACNIDVIASDIEGTIEFYNLAKSRGYDNLFGMFNSENIYDLAKKIHEWLISKSTKSTKSNGTEYIQKYYSTKPHCNKLSCVIKDNIYINDCNKM